MKFHFLFFTSSFPPQPHTPAKSSVPEHHSSHPSQYLTEGCSAVSQNICIAHCSSKPHICHAETEYTSSEVARYPVRLSLCHRGSQHCVVMLKNDIYISSFLQVSGAVRFVKEHSVSSQRVSAHQGHVICPSPNMEG